MVVAKDRKPAADDKILKPPPTMFVAVKLLQASVFDTLTPAAFVAVQVENKRSAPVTLTGAEIWTAGEPFPEQLMILSCVVELAVQGNRIPSPEELLDCPVNVIELAPALRGFVALSKMP